MQPLLGDVFCIQYEYVVCIEHKTTVGNPENRQIFRSNEDF